MSNKLDKNYISKMTAELTEKVGGRSKAAKIMGVSPTTLDNYRLGNTQPKFLEFLQLIQAAGVELTDFVGGENQNEAGVKLNQEHLTKILEIIEEESAATDLSLSAAELARIISILYSLMQKGEPKDNIIEILKFRKA